MTTFSNLTFLFALLIWLITTDNIKYKCYVICVINGYLSSHTLIVPKQMLRIETIVVKHFFYKLTKGILIKKNLLNNIIYIYKNYKTFIIKHLSMKNKIK